MLCYYLLRLYLALPAWNPWPLAVMGLGGGGGGGDGGAGAAVEIRGMVHECVDC